MLFFIIKILNELWNTPNNFRFDFFHEQSRLDEILNSHYQEGGGENILHNLIMINFGKL